MKGEGRKERKDKKDRKKKGWCARCIRFLFTVSKYISKFFSRGFGKEQKKNKTYP